MEGLCAHGRHLQEAWVPSALLAGEQGPGVASFCCDWG